MRNHVFWLLLGAVITVSIIVGVVWGIYAASWAVGIFAWVGTECFLLWLLLRTALRMEDA